MQMDAIEFIAVPIGMAIVGWLYNQAVKRASDVRKRFNELDEKCLALDRKCEALNLKIIEEYVKKAELDRMMYEINQKLEQNQTMLLDAINHMREDIRALNFNRERSE